MLATDLVIDFLQRDSTRILRSIPRRTFKATMKAVPAETTRVKLVGEYLTFLRTLQLQTRQMDFTIIGITYRKKGVDILADIVFTVPSVNVYDAIKFAAARGWIIHFQTDIKLCTIVDGGTPIAIEGWQNENGLVSPVTALIRAINQAKLKTEHAEKSLGVSEQREEVPVH